MSIVSLPSIAASDLPVLGERVLVGIGAPDKSPAERSNLVEVAWA